MKYFITSEGGGGGCGLIALTDFNSVLAVIWPSLFCVSSSEYLGLVCGI